MTKIHAVFTSWETGDIYDLTLPVDDNHKHLLLEEGEVDGSNFYPLNGMSLQSANDMAVFLTKFKKESVFFSDMDLFHTIYTEEGDDIDRYIDLLIVENDKFAIYDFLVFCGYIDDFTNAPYGAYFDVERFIEDVLINSTYFESKEHIAFKVIVLPRF